MQIWPDMHILRQAVEIAKTTLFCQLDEQCVQMLIDESKRETSSDKDTLHFTFPTCLRRVSCSALGRIHVS